MGEDFNKGYAAAQRGETFDKNQSYEWRIGYGLFLKKMERQSTIDFSNYNSWFEDYCKEHNKTFYSQKEADQFYSIWIEGFNYASYVYY